MTAVDPTRAPAVLLMDADECDERGPRWHALREQGVGGSEIGIIVLGGTAWGSPFDLFYRKRNGWRINDNKDMKIGRQLESIVHGEFTETHGPEGERQPRLHAMPGGLWAHPQRSWQRATLDAIAWPSGTGDDGFVRAVTCDRPFAVEYKVVREWDDWGPDGSDEIPVSYRCQLLWAMDVLGSTPGYLLAFNPSDRTYREYVVRYDARDVQIMTGMAERFLRRLAEDDPPDIDGSRHTTRVLKQLHPDLVDGKVEISADLAGGIRRAKAVVERAEALYRRYENRLRAQIGPVRRAVHRDRSIATRSVFVNQHGTLTDSVRLTRGKAAVVNEERS